MVNTPRMRTASDKTVERINLKIVTIVLPHLELLLLLLALRNAKQIANFGCV